MEPLSIILGRAEFVSLAELQDIFVESVYSFDKDFVLHGGTAIWRCYSGNRFSYDVDGYARSEKELERIDHNITWELTKRGARLEKYRTVGHTRIFYVANEFTRLKVEFQYDKRAPKPVVRMFEKADATTIDVLTLKPEDFIIEKMRVYNSRRYMRDIYDIYHLVNYIDDKTVQELSKRVEVFVKKIKPPLNENDLKSIVYRGAVPSFGDMIVYVDEKFA